MIVMFGVSFALEPSCPVCSKFEYEKKLLERVIRNELALKDTLDKKTETHAKVADTLTGVSQAVKGLEDTKQDLRVNVEAFLNSEGSVVPLIMFHARLQHSGTTFTYATNEDVKFNTVLVNEGGVYDPVTGHFTASVAGVYMFTPKLSVQSKPTEPPPPQSPPPLESSYVPVM
ncbi:uncharacterized protein LOC127835477 [Dreissena polymorpha]|uniref:uncharacterized protein LOC127835477 n=1 Tax=Dreissena polymorpha TaxID=45954 RepID=UPI0022650D87|nr:uncharacterized protein LOC127835477 [Dreissena polymorpha]